MVPSSSTCTRAVSPASSDPLLGHTRYVLLAVVLICGGKRQEREADGHLLHDMCKLQQVACRDAVSYLSWSAQQTGAALVPSAKPYLEGDALHGVGVEQRERDGRVGAHRRTEVQLRGVDLQPRHGCWCRACS